MSGWYCAINISIFRDAGLWDFIGACLVSQALGILWSILPSIWI